MPGAPLISPAFPRPRGLRFLLLVLLGWAALASPAELGRPSIRTYSPKEYHAQSQNWAIVQDRAGIMYVANGEGVLEFDGVRWRLIPTSNRTPVRALAQDAAGRIYVGAVGEVGYLAPDARGQMAYVSLKDRLDSDHSRFSEVWKIHPTAAGVYFFTRDFIFLMAPDGVRTWQVERPLHNGFGVGERFFVQEMDVGLLELDGQRLSPLPWGEAFKRDKIFFILPWAGQLLIGTRDRGLVLADGSKLTPFPTEADAYLKEHLLYQGALLPDGTLALATLSGGAVLLSPEGRIRKILAPSTGLSDNTVYTFCADRQGGLWMGLSRGLARVQWSSPFSRFDASLGLEGTVISLRRHHGELYAGTGQGLFRLEPRTAAGPARFQMVPGLKTQTWATREAAGGLLVGNYQGLYELKQGRVAPVRRVDSATLAIFPDSRTGKVYLGLDGGLGVLDPRGGHGAGVFEGKVPGVTNRIFTIEADDQGRLWLGSTSGEILRAAFPESPAQPLVEHFSAAQGLPVNRQVDVVKVGGRIVFATNAGVYEYLEESRRFQPDPRFAPYFASGPRRVLLLAQAPDGRVWMQTQDEATGLHDLAVGTPGGDGCYQWERNPFLRFSSIVLDAILFDPDGVVWLGGEDGLYRYDPALVPDQPLSFAAQVRREVLGEDGVRLEYSAPSFESDWTNVYQTRLDGFDRDWSAWTPDPFKKYAHLPFGDYVFRVRCRNAEGAVSGEGRWAFTLPPPWHHTWWARGLFLVLGCAGLLAAGRALRRRGAGLAADLRTANEAVEQRDALLAAQTLDLAGLAQKLRTTTEEKNQFIGMVGHDLRNPLNGIMLAAELLEESTEDFNVTRTAHMIQTECRSMDGLIGRFLDMAAIAAGTLRPAPVLCSLGELTRQAMEHHRPRANRKSIALECQIDPLVPPVFADPKFTREILDNLLSNAVKFSPLGATVFLRVEHRPEGVRLAIQDQGPGFSPGDLDHLYTPFQRLSAAPTGHEKAQGLGLSIVKAMVDAMACRITLSTAPGAGATFQVDFGTEVTS